MVVLDCLQNKSPYDVYLSIIEITLLQNCENIDKNVCTKVENNDHILPIYINYSDLYNTAHSLLNVEIQGQNYKKSVVHISTTEMKNSLIIVIKGLQLIHFRDEIVRLQKGKCVTSSVKSLHQFKFFTFLC